MTVGFQTRPTFEDLVGLAKKAQPLDVSGLRRDYFWDSPEAAWLRGPIDEVQERAMELSQRSVIQKMAMQQARTKKIPYGQAQGDFKRSIRLAGDIEDPDIPSVDGYGNMKNPAGPNDMGSSEQAQAMRELAAEVTRAKKAKTEKQNTEKVLKQEERLKAMEQRMEEYFKGTVPPEKDAPKPTVKEQMKGVLGAAAQGAAGGIKNTLLSGLHPVVGAAADAAISGVANLPRNFAQAAAKASVEYPDGAYGLRDNRLMQPPMMQYDL